MWETVIVGTNVREGPTDRWSKSLSPSRVLVNSMTHYMNIQTTVSTKPMLHHTLFQLQETIFLGHVMNLSRQNDRNKRDVWDDSLQE